MVDKSLVMNHTCIRVKDPKVSMEYYKTNFGLSNVKELHFSGFSLYMLNYDTEEVKNTPWAGREGVLELCHNHGTETDDSFKANNGNGSEFRGFGHICISVDNIEACEQKLLANDVKFQKKLSDGRQKNIAFALDPDGYWVELIEHGTGKVEAKTEMSSYKFNHSMIRVKDPKKSLDFYKNKLGMKLLAKSDHEGAKFTLYFLAYVHDEDYVEGTLGGTKAGRQSIIELTHNWGTEDDETFSYHNGNSTENGAVQGFGHFCVTADDAGKFCKDLEAEFGDELDWAIKWGSAKLSKEMAFIRDPDGYSIEIINNSFASKL